MQYRSYVSTLRDMARLEVDAFVTAFSGGVDSTYLLLWLRQHRPEARRIAVHALWDDCRDGEPRRRAERLGAEIVEVDCRNEFFEGPVLSAIRHNAYYANRYPISSSLTRPLIAGALARTWSSVGGRAAIVHSATHMQNTARRLERSLAALVPAATVCAPFVGSNLPRQEKIRALDAEGIVSVAGERYSIDATPVARVIENGTLEDPRNPIPDEGVFAWTRDVEDAPDRPRSIRIGYQSGRPVRLDDRETALQETVQQLNEIGGLHGIGRFSGLEDTAFNVKNHEVREAPGISILIEAHRTLENAVLCSDELLRKQEIDQLWTHRVAEGGWFDELTMACDAFSRVLEALVSGTVTVALHKGSVRTRAVDSPNSLSYMTFQETYERVVRSEGCELMANARDLPLMIRRSGR